MIIHALCDKYAAFSLEHGSTAGKTEAERMLRKALEEYNVEPWGRIHIDAYCAGGRSLFIAYPESETKISLAAYALPFLNDYFTE